MVVLSTDIQFRLSGGASNYNPFACLGGAKSSQQVKDDMLDSLMHPISQAQLVSGHTDYHCIYVQNNSGTSQMQTAKIWFTVVSSYIQLGIGSSAVNGTETTIADEVTAPGGVTFSQPLTEDSGLTLGTIPAGQHKSIWFKRTIPPNSEPAGSIVTRVMVKSLNA